MFYFLLFQGVGGLGGRLDVDIEVNANSATNEVEVEAELCKITI